MALQKNFLRPESVSTKTSKYRLFSGLFLGFFYSLIFYAFLYTLREAFRVISLTDDFNLWVLTEEEVNFYNLFYAFLSVILGLSLCFTQWFEKPRPLFAKRNYLITSIANDQRVLNWSFLNWASKLAVIFGILFGDVFYGGYYVFSLYPDYTYLFILLIIVLFFQTWNSISLTFKGNALKWMGISIIIVSSLAFGISKINLVDYKKINNAYLQHNIYHKYTLELPESKLYEIIPVSRGKVKTISVVESKESNAKPIIVIDTKETDLKDISHTIMEWQSTFDKFILPELVYHLQIHRNVQMGFIIKLADELSKAGVSEVAYAVLPANAKYDKKYYRDYSFRKQLLSHHAHLFDLQELNEALNEYENIIEIKQVASGDYLLNNAFMEPGKLKQALKESIQTNNDYFIKLYLHDAASFSSYLTVLSYTQEAVFELRNEYAQKLYARKYELLDDNTQKEVEDKYPYQVIEFTSDMLKSKN